MDQLELYLTYRLADDPSLDGNRLIAEFFDLCTARPREPMRRCMR